MKWKTFFQIILLIIFTAIMFYIVCPKYSTYTYGGFTRKYNRITGKDIKRKSVAEMIKEYSPE